MIKKFNILKYNSKLIFLVMILLSFIIPILYACKYVVPAADDFTNAQAWINYSGNHLRFLFHNLKNIYLTWQGTYFGNFICGFPIFYLLGYKGLRFFCFLVSMLYFVSSFLLTYSFCKFIVNRNKNVLKYTLIINIVMSIYILGTCSLSETFYWYTAICVYTLPVCFGFLSLYFYFNYKFKNKICFIILSSFFAFAAAGGALDIAALFSAIYFFFACYDLIIKRKIDKSSIAVGATLLGSIINAAAPGNFIRHGAIDTKLRLFDSINNSIIRVCTQIASGLSCGYLLLLVVVMFILGYYILYNKNIEYKYPILVSIYCFMAICITDFPVVLGYSGIEYFPDRCQFVEHISITIFLIVLSVYWGGWCAKRKIFNFSNENFLLVSLICTVIIFGNIGFGPNSNFTPYRMIYYINKGDFELVSDKEESILLQIKESKDVNTIVVLNPDPDGTWTNINKIGIKEDSTDWVNVGLANYYGKSSVKIQYSNQ